MRRLLVRSVAWLGYEETWSVMCVLFAAAIIVVPGLFAIHSAVYAQTRIVSPASAGGFGNAELSIRDTDGSHRLTLSPGSDLTADRVLTLTTGDAARTVTLSGNPTLADWFDQSVKAGAAPSLLGTNITAVPPAAIGQLSGTTGSIGGGALLAGACASSTVSVTGATTSMSATATALGGVDVTNGGVLGVSISAQVTSSNTVTVRVCAPIAGTPAATTYKVIVQ